MRKLLMSTELAICLVACLMSFGYGTFYGMYRAKSACSVPASIEDIIRSN